MNQPAARHVRKRVVLHFPGFEPLDAQAHRTRYGHAARKSASVWGLDLTVGPLVETGETPFFDIECRVAGDHTRTRLFVLDHHVLVEAFRDRPLIRRIASGFRSAWRVIMAGGLTAYFRHGWRFGLFFLFPFFLVAMAIGISLAIAVSPLWLGLPLWTLPFSLMAAALFFRAGFIPQSHRLHTLHLFADWQLAVAVASLDRPDVNRWLDACIEAAKVALREEADEYVIASHSMGSSLAAHVVGSLIEREPALFAGKTVVFATLGGAILQCALLRPAATLRAHVGRIARARGIVWFEVQCLTDPIHFYKSRVAALTGHKDAPQPAITLIRMKTMLSAERYRRAKWNLLRMHRQYVLGPDRRAPFDFTLMTAGPLPAERFVRLSPHDMPPL